MSDNAGNSRAVISNQEDVHPDLIELLNRYKQSRFARPIAHHTQAAFDEVNKRIASAGRDIILDSGCGVGESTSNLAQLYPNHMVVGVDQSQHRLSKHPAFADQHGADNLLLVQADCVDFWRLALDADWQIHKHYILYPNPWPKKSHLKRRWHGHPVFWQLAGLCESVELRSNWKTYLDEFAMAWEYATGEVGEVREFCPEQPITPFELKYQDSGQALYRLNIN